MRNLYANTCPVSGSREEVVLVLGINHAWERPRQDRPVEAVSRIVLSPLAARRFADVIEAVVREYETRFGSLPMDPRAGS